MHIFNLICLCLLPSAIAVAWLCWDGSATAFSFVRRMVGP